MSSGTSVIRAAQMFTKNGNSKNVNLPMEIAIGTGLGLAFGLMWKVRKQWSDRLNHELQAARALSQFAALLSAAALDL